MSKEVKRYTLCPQLKPEALMFLPDVVVDAKAYEALLAERDAAQKDAERYRWLRDVATSQFLKDLPKYACVETRDQAVDAALQGEQP